MHPGMVQHAGAPVGTAVCSARWKALPRMTASGISSAYLVHRCGHGGGAIFRDLCQGVPPRGWLLPAERDLQDFVLLCVIWQGIDWVRAKVWEGHCRYRGSGRWPYLLLQCWECSRSLCRRPIVSAVLAFVITSPVPMWTSITDGGWGYLVSGVLLYLLRNHRKAQVAVWALNSFLWDFVLVYLQLRGQPGFELSQMFTTYYEWFGVAAAVLMLAYNGTRGSGHRAAVLLVLPGPCLPAVWGVLPGVSPDCIKRRKMLWRIFLRLMMTRIFAHC